MQSTSSIWWHIKGLIKPPGFTAWLGLQKQGLSKTWQWWVTSQVHKPQSHVLPEMERTENTLLVSENQVVVEYSVFGSYSKIGYNRKGEKKERPGKTVRQRGEEPAVCRAKALPKANLDANWKIWLLQIKLSRWLLLMCMESTQEYLLIIPCFLSSYVENTNWQVSPQTKRNRELFFSS